MIAAKDKYNKLPKKAGLWYLIHDNIKYIDVKDINMTNLKKRVLSVIEEIEKGIFTPKPSYFAYQFCDFNKICKNAIKR